MASINVHYTTGQDLPQVSVANLPTCMVLRLEVPGGDNITLFVENEDHLADLVDRISIAFQAYLRETDEEG